MPFIIALMGQRQADLCKLKAILDYTDFVSKTKSDFEGWSRESYLAGTRFWVQRIIQTEKKQS